MSTVALTWQVRCKALESGRRFDPEFFDPRAESVRAGLEQQDAIPLSAWVSAASRGVAPLYDDDGDVRVVKTANVRRFAISSHPRQYVSTEFTKSNPTAVIPRGALLVTSTGVGSAGRTFVKLSQEPMVADAHVTVVIPRDEEDAAFLCAYLQSPVGRQQLLKHRRGSSRQIEIYPKDILSVLVPRVTPAEREAIAKSWLAATETVALSAAAVGEAQERIGDLIGDAIADSEDVTTWTQGVGGLRASRRIDAEFAAPAAERLRRHLRDCHGIPLADLVTATYKGVQPEEYSDDGEVVIIKSRDVHYPELDLSLCDRANAIEWPHVLEGGELLVNMTGQGTLGRSAVVPALTEDEITMVPSVDVCVLKLNEAYVLPGYVALFLNSPAGRLLTQTLQTGSSGQQHLYPVHFAEIPIPIPRSAAGDPDLGWQREIVAIAESRKAALDEARRRGAELDAEFADRLGIAVDMNIVPV